MTIKKWIVADQSHHVRLDDLVIRPGDVGGGAGGYEVTVNTLKAGLSEGVTTLRVDNGTLAVEVIPTRGMGIRKAWLGKEEIGWQSPVRGPVHPQFVPLAEPSGLGWLDGFDELLVRCGLESNGAPEFDTQGRLRYPLHGRIANRPAHEVSVTVDGETGEIAVTGEVDECRFHFAKLRLRTTLTTRVGEPGFRLRDEVTNLSHSPAEVQLLYHINVGRPLLDGGSRLVAPVRTVVPRNARAAEGIGGWDSYAAEQPGFSEQVYFLELIGDREHRTQVLLKNAHSTRGVSLRYDVRQLPCFTQWKDTAAIADGYVTGIEPGTNFPNPRTFEGEQGRVVKLAPGAATSFDLQFVAHGAPAEVAAAEKAIAALQAGVLPRIHPLPLPGWCAP